MVLAGSFRSLSPWLANGCPLATSSHGLPSVYASQVSLCVSKFPLLFFFFLFSFPFFLYFFIQQVLISYLFYTHQCIHVNPNLPIHPTTTPATFPTWCPYVSPLHLFFFFYFLWERGSLIWAFRIYNSGSGQVNKTNQNNVSIFLLS